MSWSSSFINSLSSPSKSVEYALRFIGYSNDYFIGSAKTIRNSGMINIGSAEVVIDNARITPQIWSVNFGGFSIQINGDLRPLDTSAFRKGAIAELHMRRDRKFPELIAIGQLRSLSGGRGVWNLEFGGLISALTSRLSTKKNELSFFYNAGKTALVTTNFNYSSDTRLYLSDITIFERDTNYYGLISVTDSSGVSANYKWSTKTTTIAPAGYLQITHTLVWPSMTDLKVLAINDVVVSVARLNGRPDFIFNRMLMSTGNATQGPFDDYPKSWGAGINFDPSLINSQSMSYYYDAWKTTSGSFEVQLLFSEPATSGIRSVINSFLSMGMFPVLCQGRIDWRVAQDPANAFRIDAKITDKDIYSIESHQIYSTSQPVVFGKSSILTSTAGGTKNTASKETSNVRGLPAKNENLRDHRYLYRIDSPAQSAKATVDLGRLNVWDLNTYEELVISCSERFAGLAAGDIVAITSSYIYGFNEGSGKSYLSKRAMILGIRWRPSASRCIITLGIV
tara:strand:+ start:6967 stop:8493 length:1527 start_codon:yes stop_codon:yes gene_type:complete